MLRKLMAHCGTAFAGYHMAAPGLENRLGRKSALLIIIDDDNEGAGQDRVLGAHGHRRHEPELLRCGDRQPNAEDRTHAHRRFCRQPIAEQLRCPPDDREAEAEPLTSRPTGVIQLIELLEYRRQFFRRNADAGIADMDGDKSSVLSAVDVYASSLAIANRIGHQIP